MTEYTPFKMKAHGTTPMKKNFGVGDSEQPIKTAPIKEGSPLFKGGGGGGGIFRKMRERMAAAKAKAMGGADAAAAGVANDPAAMGAEAAAADPAGEGGGGVAPHGPEAHSGGGGPMGGRMKMMKKFKPFGGGGGRGMIGNLFSDSRLKEKIERTGASPSGIPIYEFNYIGSNSRYSGAMAQDLLEINPDAVTVDTSGYYKVNYNNIDVDMHLINN